MASSVLLSRFTPSLMAPETLEQILVQRHNLAKELVASIQESALSQAKHFRLLIGPRGIGKTHLVTLVYYRIQAAFQAQPDLAAKLKIAWLREEEWGVASFLDLLVRIFRAIKTEYPEDYQTQLEEQVNQLFELKPQEAEYKAQAILTEFLKGQTLLILAENLDDLFQGLGNVGQKQLRAYIQNHANITILATAQSLFPGVSEREAAFFGFFRVDYLEPLSPEEAGVMLQQIALLHQDQELADYLQTSTGQARVKAVHHLAGGNPRIYVIFAQFLTRDSLDELVGAFMQMLDDLTPYYQSRMSWISAQQRKIVEYLVEIRTVASVKQIAQQCFITHQTASSQIKELLEKGYVRLADTIGRESFYELREPLMRFCLEVKKQRNKPIQLFVDFLRIWYEKSKLEDFKKIISEAYSINNYSIEKQNFLELEYLTQAFSESETYKDDPRILACWQHLKDLWEDDKYARKDEMIAIIRKLIDLRNDSEIWSFYSKYLVLIDKLDEALEAIFQAIKLEPLNIKLWMNYVEILLKTNQFQDALRSVESAIVLAPDNISVWQQRGVILMELGELGKSLASFNYVIQQDPQNALSWLGRGGALAMLGREEEAIADFAKAIALDPNWAGVYMVTAWAWANLRRFEEAVKNLSIGFQVDLEGMLDIFMDKILFGELNQLMIEFVIAEGTSVELASKTLEKFQWLKDSHPKFDITLRLMQTAIAYKQASDDKQRRRILLSLPLEERQLLEPLLKGEQEQVGEK